MQLFEHLRRRYPGIGDERGAVLMFSAFALLVVIATAALLVDLGSVRNDRAENQVAADAAATAAAVELADTSAFHACQTALAYIETNLGTNLSGADCASFPFDCDATTSTVETVGTSGGLAVTIAYPVGNSHRMMAESSTAGGPGVSTSQRDGDRCERIGVEVSEDSDAFYSGFFGRNGGGSTVRTVAKTVLGDKNNLPINLLLLDQTGCDVVSLNGGGSSGGLLVKSVVDPITGDIYPGYITSDSDASVGCGSDGVIDADGAGAFIQADGEPGCVGELIPGTGDGCGVLHVYADNPTGGCVFPICTMGSGTIAPAPTKPTRRTTRAQVDYRYNCKTGYPASFDIKDCNDTSERDPYIDQFIATASAIPAGFETYSDDHDCNVQSSDSYEIPVGNYYVDCNNLSVKGELIFNGGNLIFGGDLTIQAGGTLRVNVNNPETYDWVEGSQFDPYQHSADAAWFYLPDGDIKMTAGANLELRNVMGYIGTDSDVELGGGAGEFTWQAPYEGPFEDLAMWSEATTTMKFAGSAALDLSGVFFSPYAAISYQGGSANDQVEAQFIAYRIELGGNGSVTLAPILTRMVLFKGEQFSEMVR